MGLASRGIVGISAAIGLVVASQAPEFAQQYRQRLGGAVDELRVVVNDLDRDAQRSGMTRDDALAGMDSSDVAFVRDRGASMRRTVGRYEALDRQLATFEGTAPIARPLVILRHPDGGIVEAAWEVFEPAVPITVPGLVYGGAGALLLAFLARAGIATGRAARRGRKPSRAANRNA